MGKGLIILGVLIFLFGFLTPVNDFITLPISILVLVIGINRLLKRKK